MTGTRFVTSARSHWDKTLPIPCAGPLLGQDGVQAGRESLGLCANPSISLLEDLEFPLQRWESAAAGMKALPSWNCSGITGIRIWGL